MDAPDDLGLLDILGQLERMCPAFEGSVVATGDGLVLAAAGSYRGDTPAACATSMYVHISDDLRALTGDGAEADFRDLLVFGDAVLWYLTRLTGDHRLLICSRQTTHVGAVRLAGETVARQLDQWLDRSR